MIMETNTSKFDWAGILSASLCVVHCLLTPVLILLLSNKEWWHQVYYMFLAISFYAAFKATQNCTVNKIVVLIWLSFLILAVSILFEDTFTWLHELSYLASFGLVAGHILNIRYCKHC
jgi:hypothetical protein